MLIKFDTRPNNKLLVTLEKFMDYFNLWVGLWFGIKEDVWDDDNKHSTSTACRKSKGKRFDHWLRLKKRKILIPIGMIVLKTSKKNKKLGEWLVLQSFAFSLVWLLEKCKENEVEFFNSGFIIPFVPQESKAKDNEMKKFLKETWH